MAGVMGTATLQRNFETKIDMVGRDGWERLSTVALALIGCGIEPELAASVVLPPSKSDYVRFDAEERQQVKEIYRSFPFSKEFEEWDREVEAINKAKNLSKRKNHADQTRQSVRKSRKTT